MILTIDWVAVGGMAKRLSGPAFVFSLIFFVIPLRHQVEERFVASSQGLFQIWMSEEFQRSQQWVLYELHETTWRAFVAAHRGDYGERAFVTVGSFYNRVGYLVVYHLLGKTDRILLDTLAGPAIAAWNKMSNLVEEARLIENSTLFLDFERMLPQCYECYVPNQPVPEAVREAAEEAAKLAESQSAP